MSLLFLQLGAVLGIATVVSLVMRWLRQPLLVGYIITGLFVGPAVLSLVHEGDVIDSFGKMGVVFLLFMVGLGLRPKLIREVGGISVVTGLGQIAFTIVLGYFLAIALGYPFVTALYLAAAFTFSSTIVVLQLLHTKEEQDTLYGRISIGFLLVQDFVAMLLFLVLTSVGVSPDYVTTFFLVLAKMAVITIAVGVLMVYILPRVEHLFERSREALFLFALAVCFGFAAGFATLGFSQELGALLAGVLLSHSRHHHDIALKLSPLRDFFIMMFFVVLGTHVSVQSLEGSWLMIVLFTAFILIGNPLIVMVLMRSFGYTVRTSFFAGLTVAQISEFSLILLATGATLGHLPVSIIGPATAIGLITIFLSSYFIIHNKRLYEFCAPFLHFIFGSDAAEDDLSQFHKPEVILFGCHRLGIGVIDALEAMKVPFLVVDHDPEVIAVLNAADIPHVFGTANDIALLESLPLQTVKTVISTIPDTDEALPLVTYVRDNNSKATILSVANHQSDAAALYEAGATYVVVPPYLGRRYMVDLLKTFGLSANKYRAERSNHLRELLYLKENVPS